MQIDDLLTYFMQIDDLLTYLGNQRERLYNVPTMMATEHYIHVRV